MIKLGTFYLKNNLFSVIKFTIVLILIFLLYFSFYPAFASDMKSYLSNVDPSIIKALKIDQLTSASGYYAYLISLIMIPYAYLVISLSLKIFNNKQDNELLYLLPLNNKQIYYSLYLSNIILLLISYLLFIISTAITYNLLSDGTSVSYINLTLLIFLLFLSSLSTLLYALIKKIRFRSSVLFITFISYGLSIISNLFNLTSSNILVVFTYFSPYTKNNLIIPIGLAIFLIISSQLIYKSEDL